MMKKYLCLSVIFFCLILAACASVQDLEKAKQDIGRQTDQLKSQANTLDRKVKSLEMQTDHLMRQTTDLKKGSTVIRQKEANEFADIDDIRDSMNALTGRIEVIERSASDIKGEMTRLHTRITFMEKYLNLDEQKSGRKVSASQPDNSAPEQGKTAADKAYETAWNSFKDENFARARSEFAAYLALHPKDGRAADASYWIGECYYFENNFDSAILQYDKVVKDYPQSDKVPRALFKEGLSFDKLNDRLTAKLLLQQVIQTYPDTPEARIAQNKIDEMHGDK